jgi:hypothetical protein
MPLTPKLGQVVLMLREIFQFMQIGLVLSTAGIMSHQLAILLSKFTRLDEPDPTEWFRAWRQFFDRVFLPVGERVVSEHRPRDRNQLLFQLGVSFAVVVVTMSAYVFFSGTVIGAMLVSYYSMGFAPDLSHLMKPGAALILLVAFSVILYSAERAKETV